MAATLFSIQELCDQIASHVALQQSSESDLKSLALVCHALCSAAQSRIFHQIVLDPDLNDHLRLDSSLDAAITRLTAILEKSLHLRTHVCRVVAVAKPEILQRISGLQLPCLRAIRLRFTLSRLLDAHILQVIRDLIGSPAIREVELVHSYHELDIDQFGSLFETCTPYLGSISLDNFHFTSDRFSDCVPLLRENRAHIKTLVLGKSADKLDWLVSPSCPFDFTHLVDVEMDSRKNTPLLKLLTASRLTITRIAIFGDLAMQLNLSELPHLTWVETDHATYELISSLAPENAVEMLVVHLRAVELIQRHAPQSFSATDDFFADAPLPTLHQLEARTHGWVSEDFCAVVEAARRCFPRVQARGLLVVTDARVRDRYGRNWDEWDHVRMPGI
ncbi:hypothetical protein B0H19DRAFT_1159654 [Mycena capillaripes]|nr:hypothetical protein B0H19DRAFT_1159654 [Mycena capillaripes]